MHPYLERFVAAQAPVYSTVISELEAGRKQSHWMWFVFPQIEGLGRSEMAHHYSIGPRAEAKAYIAHPILGARLLECTGAVLEHKVMTALQIFGTPDDLKFRSSMTLFSLVGGKPSFKEALDCFFDGDADEATQAIFSAWKS